MTNKHTRIISLLALLVIAIAGCIDDSSIEYNDYYIRTISTPVDRDMNTNNKKVYIGHNLPVNVILNADYAEDNVPLQVYLLNVDDVRNVELKNASIEDIRMYFIHVSPQTTIDHVLAGSNTYGIIINVPAEQAKDPYTGDYKIGTYYVVAEVNKYDRSEINPYKVYRELRHRLDENNTIYVATDYMKKPDLSIESMNFTGAKDDPRDVITFYNLDLATLPGMQHFDLDIIPVRPNITDRTFTGSVTVKSSSSDSINVPVTFYIATEDDSVKVPLEIYDPAMKAFMDIYYIPILRKNTAETIALQLRIPDDKGSTDYFSNVNYDSWSWDAWNSWDQAQQGQYRLSALRHSMPKDEYKNYKYKIVAAVNATGSIQESRFVKPNGTNSEYTENDYNENGTNATLENNTMSEDIIFKLTKMDAEANIGTVFYPWEKLDSSTRTEQDKQVVLSWIGASTQPLGNDDFGGLAEIHGGMLFHNFSLLSWGYQAVFNIFDQPFGVKTYFNAESHPFNFGKSYYDYSLGTVELSDYFPGHEWDEANAGYSIGDIEIGDMQGNILSGFSDTKIGFGEYNIVDVETIPPFEITIPIEAVGTGVEIKVRTKPNIVPYIAAQVNQDGSLGMDGGLSLGVRAGASIGAEALEGLVGIEIGIDLQIFAIDGIMSGYTKTYFSDIAEYRGKVRGSLAYGPSIWISPPNGDIFVVVSLLGIEIKITIVSFKSGRYLIYSWELGDSGKTWWNTVANEGLIDYEYLKQQETDGKKDSCYLLEQDDLSSCN